MAKSSSRSASQILEIHDPLTAFALDASVAQVMLEWENKRDYLRLKALIQSLAAMLCRWFGVKWEPPSENDDEDSVPLDEDDVL